MTNVIAVTAVRRMRSAVADSDAFEVLKSAAVGAVAVLTLGVLAFPGGDETTERAAPRLPAPEVLAPTIGRPVQADDGLVHLIVTPTGAPDGESLASAPPADPAPVEVDANEATGGSSIGATDGDSAWTIDPGEGQLVLVDGQLMRRDASGSLVPAAGSESGTDAVAPTEADAPEEADAHPDPIGAAGFGHPAIDALAAREGVEQVIPIGDGSFAVGVVDAAVLDDLPLDAAADTPLALFADPYESYQWALENTGTNLNGVSGAPAQREDADIDAATAWASATGAGVVVAVIDSGVDFSHPDLAPNRWSNLGETCGNGIDDDGNGYVDDCHGWDFGYDDNQPFNPGAHAHGTHVAGIIAAEAGNGVGVAGVAPDALIMDLNVGRITPSGEPAISTSALARAVRYAADNGADIINLSLGTPPGTPRAAMTTLESAIVHAGGRGALVVVAAGNDTANLDGANTAWPASYDFPYIVTVAATAPDETLAGFSNYGSVIDVAAPGHVILSTAPAANGSYLFMSGTSQATPVVAGVAALALDADPSLTAAGLREAIRSSSDRHDAYVGRVPDGLRANAGNLVAGTTPEVGFDEVAVSVSGLAGANDLEPIAASLDIVVPTDAFDEPFRWNATLVSVEADGDYVVIDHAIGVDGTTHVTDENGAVDLALAGSGNVDLTTSLPEGRYALVLEPIADADPGSRLGDAFVATFDVADGSAPSTTAPTTTTIPSTTVPSTTAPPAGGTPSPTTTAPATTAPPVGGGGSPTTTVSPSPTTLPPVGSPSPTTTAPTTTSTLPSTPPTPPPTTQPPSPGPTPSPTTTAPPVSAGEWMVSGVAPAEGPVDTMNLVRLSGSFPEAAYVWFGEQPGVVIASSPYTIDVLTPIRGAAGVVDISLVPPSSPAALVVPSAYTFVSDSGTGAGEPSSPTTTTAPSPTTTLAATPTIPPGSGSPTTTIISGPSPSPGPTPTTTVVPTDPGGSPAPTSTIAASDPGTSPSPTSTTVVANPEPSPTTTLAPSPRRPRAALGDRIDLSSGLRGRRITGDSPLGSAPLCTTDPCSMG